MKFKLEINLGNDAMRSLGDIRDALRELITKTRAYPCVIEDRCKIFDKNGNSVGYWEVTSD